MNKGLIIFGQNIKIPDTVARHHTPSLAKSPVRCGKKPHIWGFHHSSRMSMRQKKSLLLHQKTHNSRYFFPQIIHLNILQFAETYYSTFLRIVLEISSEVVVNQFYLKYVVIWLQKFFRWLIAFFQFHNVGVWDHSHDLGPSSEGGLGEL